MEFNDYLKQQNAPSTAARYQREAQLFFLSLESQNIQPETATYRQIMDYLGHRRKQTKSLGSSLAAIKKYYNYLIISKIRKDNPAQSIILRDRRNRDIQLQDLFKPTELERLMERKERYPLLKNRNKIVISLLIYQALKTGEIKSLEIKDFDLEAATVSIAAGRKTNSRTLKLKPKQIFYLMEYLQNDRPKLLRTATQKLIIGKLGAAETGEGISYIVETQKHLFPSRKLTPITIRQSVIANLLKAGKDLRIVQAFAGHKYPSTTERYRQTELEELRRQILKHHPLG